MSCDWLCGLVYPARTALAALGRIERRPVCPALPFADLAKAKPPVLRRWRPRWTWAYHPRRVRLQHRTASSRVSALHCCFQTSSRWERRFCLTCTPVKVRHTIINHACLNKATAQRLCLGRFSKISRTRAFSCSSEEARAPCVGSRQNSEYNNYGERGVGPSTISSTGLCWDAKAGST